MTILFIAKCGQNQMEKLGTVAEKIKELIYESLDGLPVAMAVGVLEIVKLEMLQDQAE